MENYFSLNKKGQVALEFIFLISIAMVYLSAVVLPSFEIAKNSASDVTELAQARMSAEKLANTIDAVASSSNGAKQTIILLVPPRTTMKCDTANQKIVFEFKLGNYIDGSLMAVQTCTGAETKNCCGIRISGPDNENICNKEFATSPISCAGSETIGAFDNGYAIPVEATVEKTGSNVTVTLTPME